MIHHRLRLSSPCLSLSLSHRTAPASASASASSSSALPASSVPFLLAQLQSLRSALAADEAEKHALASENAKLKYRIATLLRSLDEEEKRNAGQGAPDSSSAGQHSVGDVKHALDKIAA